MKQFLEDKDEPLTVGDVAPFIRRGREWKWTSAIPLYRFKQLKNRL
jgi:hypothetical protein